MRKLVSALACRAGGSRLYGKPLQNLDIEKRLTVIEYMLDFVLSESVIEEAVLGVSEGIENEIFHEIAARKGVKSIRGDETDVLGRLIQCGASAGATDVFRITTESPYIYYEAIQEAWERHLTNENDVTSIAGLPDGSGFEIITMPTLQRSHDHGESRHRSELCTLYVRENQASFRVEVLEAPPSVARDDLRLTIDYPEDLVLCRAVYEHLKTSAPRIPLGEIVSFLDQNSHYKKLVSAFVQGGRWYS